MHPEGRRPRVMYLAKSRRSRFSYTKDFCSLHIHGLYLYNTQGFIANTNLRRTKKTDSMFYYSDIHPAVDQRKPTLLANKRFYTIT